MADAMMEVNTFGGLSSLDLISGLESHTGVTPIKFTSLQKKGSTGTCEGQTGLGRGILWMEASLSYLIPGVWRTAQFQRSWWLGWCPLCLLLPRIFSVFSCLLPKWMFMRISCGLRKMYFPKKFKSSRRNLYSTFIFRFFFKFMDFQTGVTIMKKI